MAVPVRSQWWDFSRLSLAARTSPFEGQYVQAMKGARLSWNTDGALTNASALVNQRGANPQTGTVANIRGLYDVNFASGNGANTGLIHHASDTGRLYYTPVLGTSTLIKDFASTNHVSITVLDDRALCTNGVDTPIVFSNTYTASNAGIDRPVVSAGATVALSKPDVSTATVALSAGGSNNVVGNVKHYICKVTNDKEGALSDAIDEAGVECGTGNRVAVDLTNAAFGSNKYNIYRTKANGTTPYYVGTQTGGGTYTDDIADEKAADGTGGLGDRFVGEPTGEVRGAVKYYISEVTGTDPIVESALSVSFAPVDCGDGDRPVLTFNNAEFYSNKYKIYRTTKDGGHPFFLAQIEVASGTPGTKFTDTVPDGELGDLPFKHGDPPLATFRTSVRYLNRVFSHDDAKVYWSDPGDPESWWTASNGNWIEIEKDDGDEILALSEHPLGLVVFKENHIYLVSGRTPSDFQVVPVFPGHGSAIGVGPPRVGGASVMLQELAIDSTPYGIVFVYHGRLFLYSSGGSVVQLGSSLDTVFSSPLWYHLQVAYDHRTGEVLVAFPDAASDLGDGQWGVYGYSFAKNGWVSHYDINVAGIRRVEEFIYAGLADDDGYGYFSADESVAPSWTDGATTVPRLTTDSPHALKRYMSLVVQYDSALTSDLDVKITIDGTVVQTTTLTSGTDSSPVTIDIGAIGRHMDVEFKRNSGSADKQWKVYGYGANYQILGQRRQLLGRASVTLSGGPFPPFTR